VVVLVGVLVAGCGVTPTVPFIADDSVGNRGVGAQVYFRFDHRPFKVLRPGPRDRTPGERLDLLFAGPSDVERAAGITTALPEGYVVVSSPSSPFDGSLPQVVVVDGAAGLDGFGEEAGEQVACTVANGLVPFTVVVRDAAGGERGPYDCG
jgi:hypothetical protein